MPRFHRIKKARGINRCAGQSKGGKCMGTRLWWGEAIPETPEELIIFELIAEWDAFSKGHYSRSQDSPDLGFKVENRQYNGAAGISEVCSAGI